MKRALDAFDELQDASSYALSDWLRLPFGEEDEAELTSLNAATAFLFDRLFAKENAGGDITEAARKELKDRFDPHRLSDLASELLARTKGVDFEKDPGHFSEYFRFIGKSEDYVKNGLEDQQGLLALVYIEKLVSVIMKVHRDQAGLRVGEIVFVNLTAAWRLIYKDLYGDRYPSLKSSSYFDGVEEAGEQIRSEINE